MHLEAREFLARVAKLFPEFYNNKRVIDIGSGDINGNNRSLFTNCFYCGVDVVAAPNVDLVCKGKDVPEDLGVFDTVISSECFEHDNQVFQTLQRILRLVRAGGLFVFTCAGTGRKEHGTKRTSSNESYSQQLAFDHRSEWYPNYYQNLSMEDIVKMIGLERYFTVAHFEYNEISKDLYFYGLRNQNQNYAPINKLSQVFDRHNTDKNSSFHNYSRQYDCLIERFRYKNIRLLEIGVFDGQSLRAWRDALPNAYSVVGIDIDPRCKAYQAPDDGIYVEIGDQSDREFLTRVVAKYGPFDLIIDDGSHRNDHVIASFDHLFPLLADNGLYIVEDTICYKSAHYQKEDQPNHLEYFWQLTKFLNQWNLSDGQGARRDHCIDPFKIIKTTTDPLEYGIDKIEFGTSYIAITKLVRSHWIPAAASSSVVSQSSSSVPGSSSSVPESSSSVVPEPSSSVPGSSSSVVPEPSSSVPQSSSSSVPEPSSSVPEPSPSVPEPSPSVPDTIQEQQPEKPTQDEPITRSIEPRDKSDDFGFIITRHVNNEQTNKYWQLSYDCIRRFYDNPIIIIDDNSNQDFITAHPTVNCQVIKSQFPKRAELLGYYYFHKLRPWTKAIILHDSVFINGPIFFGNREITPIWHFPNLHCREEHAPSLLEQLDQAESLLKKYNDLTDASWNGCYGVMSVISLTFLDRLVEKYNFFNLLNFIDTRPKRMGLERVFGLLAQIEDPTLTQRKSLFGSILTYYNNNLPYSFDQYLVATPRSIEKVYTGR